MQYTVNQTANTAVIIGGVRSLTDFSPEHVTVSVHGATIAVAGKKLAIARFDENEIEITGRIENVETINTRKRTL